jgi:hypothetical protein
VKTIETSSPIDPGPSSAVPNERHPAKFQHAYRWNIPTCGLRRCHCSCHATEAAFGRFWNLEYTTRSRLLRKCDYAKCSTRRGIWKFRLSFSQYGLPWAVIGGLEFLSQAGSYSIRPALQVQRVVRYTSPGFETLFSLRYGEISLQETERRFRSLARSDPTFRTHEDPSGTSYVQVSWRLCNLNISRMFVTNTLEKALVDKGPWIKENEFRLLQLLVCELGVSLQREDHR